MDLTSVQIFLLTEGKRYTHKNTNIIQVWIIGQEKEAGMEKTCIADLVYLSLARGRTYSTPAIL